MKARPNNNLDFLSEEYRTTLPLGFDKNIPIEQQQQCLQHSLVLLTSLIETTLEKTVVDTNALMVYQIDLNNILGQCNHPPSYEDAPSL